MCSTAGLHPWQLKNFRFDDKAPSGQKRHPNFHRPKECLDRNKSFSTKNHERPHGTWMDGGANGNYIRNRELFFDYERVSETEVDNWEGQSKFVGIGTYKAIA